MACRLELKGNKHVLGEFLEFKGKQEDVEALRHIRRSKVGRMIIQKTSMFGLGNLLGINYAFAYQLDLAVITVILISSITKKW